MEVKTMCINCKKYYVFHDDKGEILAQGCKLDLPIFNSHKSIVCNSYNDR